MFVTQKTLLIEVSTQKYPLSLQQLQSKVTQYSFGNFVDVAVLRELGYEVVEPVEPPLPDGYTEDKPQLVDGRYVQTYKKVTKTAEDILREFTDVKQHARNHLTSLLQKALTEGCQYNFGTVRLPDIQRIRMLESDRGELLWISEMSERFPTKTHLVRTAENKVYPISSSVAGDLLNTVLLEYDKIVTEYWRLEKAIADASDKDTIPTLPEKLV